MKAVEETMLCGVWCVVCVCVCVTHTVYGVIEKNQQNLRPVWRQVDVRWSTIAGHMCTEGVE